MLEILKILVSWPITILILGLFSAFFVNRRAKQIMDRTDTALNIRASQAVTVHDSNHD